MAVDAGGNLYVAESAAGRVTVCDPDGSALRQIGALGAGDGRSSQPAGVVLDGASKVLVADSGNGRVQKFAADGAWLVTPGAGVLSSPRGVAVEVSGECFVSDAATHCIQRFAPGGTPLGAFGGPGSGAGELSPRASAAPTR